MPAGTLWAQVLLAASLGRRSFAVSRSLGLHVDEGIVWCVPGAGAGAGELEVDAWGAKPSFSPESDDWGGALGRGLSDVGVSNSMGAKRSVVLGGPLAVARWLYCTTSTYRTVLAAMSRSKRNTSIPFVGDGCIIVCAGVSTLTAWYEYAGL